MADAEQNVDPYEDRRSQPFYCPACGRGSSYQRECVGLGADRPHPPVEMVGTDELTAGNEDNFTKAPNTEQ